jgi:hypothetical protein
MTVDGVMYRAWHNMQIQSDIRYHPKAFCHMAWLGETRKAVVEEILSFVSEKMLVNLHGDNRRVVWVKGWDFFQILESHGNENG